MSDGKLVSLVIDVSEVPLVADNLEVSEIIDVSDCTDVILATDEGDDSDDCDVTLVWDWAEVV